MMRVISIESCLTISSEWTLTKLIAASSNLTVALSTLLSVPILKRLGCLSLKSVMPRLMETTVPLRVVMKVKVLRISLEALPLSSSLLISWIGLVLYS